MAGFSVVPAILGNELFMSCSNTYPCQPVEGEGILSVICTRFKHLLTLVSSPGELRGVCKVQTRKVYLLSF